MNARTLVILDKSEKLHVIDVRSEEELEVKILLLSILYCLYELKFVLNNIILHNTCKY